MCIILIEMVVHTGNADGETSSGAPSTVRQMNPETKATLEALAEEFPVS